MITVEGKDYITIDEAVEASGCCRSTIYNLIRSERLKTTKYRLGKFILIDKKSWDKLLKERKGSLSNYPRAVRTKGRNARWRKLGEYLDGIAEDVTSVTLEAWQVRKMTNSEATFSLRTFADSGSGTLGPVRYIREAGWYMHKLSLEYDKKLGFEVITTWQFKRIKE